MIPDHMRAFAEAGIATFPLHPIMPDGSCGCGKPKCKDVGKHPRNTNWQHSAVPDDDAIDLMEASGQLATGYGVVVQSANLLVVDSDPRNGGDKSLAKLIEQIPEVGGAGLVVETGRRDGGQHRYFRLPADTSLVQTLKDYPGLDFKSSGYVVGPGSLHEAGHHYRTLTGSPFDIEAAPVALVELLKRTTDTTGSNKQSDVDPAALAAVLDAIPNTNDTDYEIYIRVGMGIQNCGGTIDQWHAWAERSGKYDSRDVDKKWRSFGDRDIEVTFGTLCFYAKQAGADLSEIAKGYNPDGTPILTFDELIEAASELDPDSDNIEEVVLSAAHLGPVQKRKLHMLIKDKTGIPLGILKEQERAGDQGQGAPDHLDIARQLIDEIGADNVLSTDAFVYAWQGTGVWEKQRDRAVKQWVQHFIGEGTKVDAVAKSNVDSIADLFRTEVFNPGQQFDIGPPECVNVLNGELTLINGQWILQAHCREHFRTTQLPVAYDPKAMAPQFVRFLHQIFKGDPDSDQKIQAVLEMVGYTLMAHCRHERFVILIGTGANGKSVLLYVLEHLCGSANVAGVQPSQFDNKFQRAHLHGKLANIVTELREGAVIDDDALKGITSGETTTVEHKHKDPFDMRPFSTCWFGTNHMPHTRDFSDALFRRALPIEFNQVFKPELGNCDDTLKERLVAEELPGILNLALDAYANAISNGFTLPDSCKQAREKWRLEADNVAQFVDECCHQFAGASETVADLYTAYKEWSDEVGIRNRLKRGNFTERLVRLGAERGRQGGTGKYTMQGVGLRPDRAVAHFGRAGL